MKIFFAEHFRSQIKRLKKKYPHTKEDLLNALEKLNLENEIHIGQSVYKIRIKSRDMNKGKSAGFRSYIYCYHSKNLLVPLCIYAKPDTASLSETELQYHFDKINEELITLKK
jgi:hypothetical protein